jgi:ferrous iron transport protein B
LIRIALVGQPNCGKSTIFNHLVGYKAHTSNLPGTTVEYLTSHALIGATAVEIVDLPGTYSLVSLDAAESETRNYLLTQGVGAVLNVIDASLLSRSLELTIQLLELGRPLVVCLNMADEARRKGIRIDVERLSDRLGVPVVEATAVRGVGVKEAALRAVRTAEAGVPAEPLSYGKDVEDALTELEAALHERGNDLPQPPRFVATKLLERDPVGAADERTDAIVAAIEARRGRSGDSLLAAERHALAMEIAEATSVVGRPTLMLRDRIDAFLMHPVFGLVALAAILFGLFQIVFRVGAYAEGPILALFDQASALLAAGLPASGIAFHLVNGLLQGIGGAVGIVIPYLVPFLLGLSILEDIGYLPRAGYLIDGLMHRVGLHGTSIIPFILGYGCSVPAVMATRILSSPRDRFVTAMLAVMVPCAARATIIYGLVGYFLGPTLAFAVYVINIVVIAVAGRLLVYLFPRVSPGLILEIPSYKIPSIRVLGAKLWLHLRDFLLVAVPILLAGSVVLGLLEYSRLDRYLNLAARPITWSLGLPLALGIPLVFGIFRKELALVMLFQALGTTAVLGILSPGQVMTYTLFLLFYVPCIATIAVLKRELGWARTGTVLGATTAIALVVGLVSRGIAAWIG